MLKSLVMNSGSESCLRPVVLELWAEVSCLKGKTDTLQYSHTFLRPQTDMTFQGKRKKKKKLKTWLASLAKRQNFCAALRRAIMTQHGFD